MRRRVTRIIAGPAGVRHLGVDGAGEWIVARVAFERRNGLP
ncbi:MAG TPA: hypothetical protein VFZ13_04310 [Gemmatimonadales bacterium]